MKRATITRRELNGEELGTIKGWQAEIAGVPVVVCRDLAEPHRWICCEPRTGLMVSARLGSTREEVLTMTRRQVEKAAKGKSQSPGSFLAELVTSFLPTAAKEG